MDLQPLFELLRPHLPTLLWFVFWLAAAKIALGSTGKILLVLYKNFDIPRGYYLKVRFLVRSLIYLVTFLLVLLSVKGIDQKIIALIGIGIGVLVSLSSTTTIGNAVAGIILHATRPIREGDRVEIDGVYGDVVSLELLFVHLKTIKDEIVSIPALKVLNGRIVNYSQLDRIILHVNLTLGYDLDPGVVEDLLLKSLGETEGVLEDPKPFILIRGLNDYTVEYEANGYIDKPSAMVGIKSKLMRNIITEFTNSGVQIMSPSYLNITQMPCEHKIIPAAISCAVEAKDQASDDAKKKIVEAKHKLEEKKKEKLKLGDKK
ncbi:MAG: mechanosensitive ion channel [Candidatus Altiarchaeales archaeon]|nr:mechanosensitive ion channel [Candidatus Altiarchaeales archaeon]MBD3416974.1 mechanosensitive ion channel [Candidatus Altiarchaeales archaeon]